MSGSTAAELVFDPVHAPTTFQETVERLGSAIRLGLLASGTRLPPERDLADQLGISRSTLRQAITTLVQSGHLQSVRGRGGGTFVVEEPPLAEGGRVREDWREVLSMRAVLETGAILLAAERADDRALDQLAGFVDTMAAGPDFEVYRRADIGFHIGIAEAIGSQRVVALMTEVQAEVSELIAQIAHPSQVLTHSNQEHSRMVAALRNRDGARAVRLMRRHLEGTEHILAGLLP
jgi:GntR family transcriptional regulator, transcriptional repressor for pyruvate dehydrogenase complex